MSVLIRGMEMPKNCSECRMWSICTCLNDFEDYESICYAVDDGDLVRDKNCPLIDIPTPHGRLIDGDEMIRIWDGATIEGSIKPLIEARPTVIEAEGREE